jgi:hypothetical protein
MCKYARQVLSAILQVNCYKGVCVCGNAGKMNDYEQVPRTYEWPHASSCACQCAQTGNRNMAKNIASEYQTVVENHEEQQYSRHCPTV